MNVPDYFSAGAYDVTDLEPTATNDEGQTLIARHLAHECAGQILHVHGLGWLYWDGTRWAEDQGDKHVRNLLLEVLGRAVVQGITGHRSVLEKAARQGLRSDTQQRGILSIASVLPALSASAPDLDADPWALNVANGTVDLHTMTLRPHNPADRITKVCKGAWDPTAHSPEWEKFITRVLPDPDVRSYLQRYAGLSLLGVVREHVLGIATGTGANGKGTFYEAFMNAVGDYAHAAENDLFMTTKSNANAASPALLALRGVRFIVCSETEEGQALASALMKNLTGGDRITARPLYGMPVTFTPSHTALMVTNFLPIVKGNDPAVWRRLRIIPFNVVIPPAQRDPGLPERLRLAADAVLSWAMEGLRDYLENGMQDPDAVTAATAAYAADSDAVRRFVDEMCDMSPAARITRNDLWSAWGRWAAETGEALGTSKDLYKDLERRFGVTTKKVMGTRMLSGIGLQDA